MAAVNSVGGTPNLTRPITVAATQFACTPDIDVNLRKAENLIRMFPFPMRMSNDNNDN